MINKNQYQKLNSKKVLHKIKKVWVVISLALMGLLGVMGFGNANSNNVHADTTNNQNHTNQNTQTKAKPAAHTLVNNQKASNTTTNNSNNSSNTNNSYSRRAKAIEKNAREMFSQAPKAKVNNRLGLNFNVHTGAVNKTAKAAAAINPTTAYNEMASVSDTIKSDFGKATMLNNSLVSASNVDNNAFAKLDRISGLMSRAPSLADRFLNSAKPLVTSSKLASFSNDINSDLATANTYVSQANQYNTTVKSADSAANSAYATTSAAASNAAVDYSRVNESAFVNDANAFKANGMTLKSDAEAMRNGLLSVQSLYNQAKGIAFSKGTGLLAMLLNGATSPSTNTTNNNNGSNTANNGQNSNRPMNNNNSNGSNNASNQNKQNTTNKTNNGSKSTPTNPEATNQQGNNRNTDDNNETGENNNENGNAIHSQPASGNGTSSNGTGNNTSNNINPGAASNQGQSTGTTGNSNNGQSLPKTGENQADMAKVEATLTAIGTVLSGFGLAGDRRRRHE